MNSPEPSDEQSDPDDFARKEALRFVGRRAAIWTAPLALIGLLMVGLGIPWWASLAVTLVAFAVVVFELDL